MAIVTVEEALDRMNRLERNHRLKAMSATAGVMAVGQLLFASFVFGHGQGPISLTPLEMLLGMTSTLLISLLVAPWFVGRRRRKEAEFLGWATEGRHRRRVLGYEDHVILAGELILYDTVERYRLEPNGLTIRYYDPRHEGPVLRELEMPEALAERLARRCEASGATADSPLPSPPVIQ